MEPMRLLVRGPLEYPDYSFIKLVLDTVTFSEDDVILISDCKVNKDYHINPSHFPLAEKWFFQKWKINAHRDGDKTKFSRLFRHHTKQKKDNSGDNERRIRMVSDSTKLVVFHRNKLDTESKECIKLAKVYDVSIKVVELK